jgi:hypothetical protein
VYSKGSYSIFEVDGEIEKLYCQNLSLFAKLFLDTKSVFFDVATFLYYLLVFSYPNPQHPDQICHQVIGFFSKEKMSWDQNNLACILVFPPWQRNGLGKILMGISYELSKLEQKIGGPEKPLSDLGRRGYLSFWSSTIAQHILTLPTRKTTSIKNISESLFILPEDVLYALKEMNVLNPHKKSDGTAVTTKAIIREWIRSNNIDLTPVVDPDAFDPDFVAEMTATQYEEDVEEG